MMLSTFCIESSLGRDLFIGIGSDSVLRILYHFYHILLLAVQFYLFAFTLFNLSPQLLDVLDMSFYFFIELCLLEFLLYNLLLKGVVGLLEHFAFLEYLVHTMTDVIDLRFECRGLLVLEFSCS